MNELTSRVIQVASGQTGRSFLGTRRRVHVPRHGRRVGRFHVRARLRRRLGRRPAAAQASGGGRALRDYVGSITFTAGSDTRTVSAGESVFVPRGTRHSYRNEDPTPARDDRRLHALRNGGLVPRGLHAGRGSGGSASSGDRRADPPDARRGATAQRRVGRLSVSPPAVAVARLPAGGGPMSPLPVATIRTRAVLNRPSRRRIHIGTGSGRGWLSPTPPVALPAGGAVGERTRLGHQ